ncbi:uncharacterized protein LOC135085944 [Ostrinia nubilalis]|uniref:uncharacterized protein LOC135085944 n=1 Tax=Ostrinia nubilalis TaxID=29057 RepID=UPI00308243AA
MFCVQEAEHSDPFANAENDPLSNTTQSESSDEEPAAKRHKAFSNSSFDLQVYQIPAFNTPKSLSIFPSTQTSTLPKFVNNPLNLANPLSLTNTAIKNSNSIVKNLHSRYSLPAKLTITPVTTPSKNESGEVVRYKKNGEVAKKRGPPKGYKRKPKGPMFDASALLQNTALLQAHNKILTSLLAASHSSMSMASGPSVSMPPPPPPPQVKVPEGHELVEMQLDPADWFPAEPYRMVFSRKKNPKWKNFPYRCEHCFKGYRVVSTLLTHAAERHGCVPKDMAIPCPCCPHVSTRRKQHKKHLETHEGRRRRIFCLYCLPPSE